MTMDFSCGQAHYIQSIRRHIAPPSGLHSEVPKDDGDTSLFVKKVECTAGMPGPKGCKDW